jgi:Arc/MetJ-type ribon-helix-helix transcriptional regulator
MASRTISFAVADEDRERLDRLVEHFGNGNRSAYLRATLKVMESLRRAERLRDLQALNHGRSAQQGISSDDLPDLIHEACKGPNGDLVRTTGELRSRSG